MPTPRAPSLRTGGGWDARGVALLGLLAACDTERPQAKAEPGPAPAATTVVAWGSTRGQASPPVIERPVAGLSADPAPAGVETPAGAAEHNATVYPGAEELCGDGVVNDLARREAGVTAELCIELDGTADAFATYKFSDRYDRDDHFTIASLGDLDGDGVHELGAGLKSDALLTSEVYDPWTDEWIREYSDRGSVLVLPGPLSPTTFGDPTRTFSLPEAVYGVDTADRIGAGLAGMGDLDGDGYGELIFGNLGSPDMVWLASGPAFTDMAEAQLIYSEPAGGCASNGAASSPDLSGDGRPDVVIGNPCADLVLVYAGASLREGAGLPTPIARLQSGLGWREGFGGGLHADADLTGDGVADLVVAAPKANGVEGVDRPPYVLVYPGPVRGSLGPEDAAVRLTAEVVDEFTEGISGAGWALSAGDADGDGYADLAVGDPYFIDRAEDDVDARLRLGRVSVFPGPLTRSMLLNESAAELQSQSVDYLGGQVDMRRDLDGDGRADLFISSGVNRGENCTCGPGTGGNNEAYIFLAPFGGHRFAASAEITFRNTAVEDWGSQGEVTGDMTGDGW
ncbi:MAG: FG-GAP repeat protein, partial [Deltaproteobacteria bacterium]|nr:FG-GAP repeat protein [Deltaproteobacteria bacterium]